MKSYTQPLTFNPLFKNTQKVNGNIIQPKMWPWGVHAVTTSLWSH